MRDSGSEQISAAGEQTTPHAAGNSAAEMSWPSAEANGSDEAWTDRIFTAINWTGVSNSTDGVNCPTQGMHTSGKPSDITWDDATWILTSSFIIFTMQSGFGLLESGMVGTKNEVNILVKNAVDVIFGGLSFWLFGFGILFENYINGDPPNKNMLTGTGPFMLDASAEDMGYIFSCFIFQLSFSTTATTIVSGAMAERTKLLSYIVFSFMNTAIYSFPAFWVWAPSGFLRQLGMVDIAGAGPVHLVGGFTGLVATVMLKPRTGRFEGNNPRPPDMGCPTNAILGMFMLWWGWLGFNTGSTFGISGGKWKLAARSAVATVLASMGGGATGVFFSFITKKRKFDISDLINGVLGSLVSITAICALAHPWEALLIGAAGGLFAVGSVPLLARLKIDDPVGAISVHGITAIWGLVSVGLFVEEDRLECLTQGRRGLFRGGGFYLLGVQLLACVVLVAWTSVLSIILLKTIDITLGLRLTEEEELLGADIVEHGIDHGFAPPPTPTRKGAVVISNFSNGITKELSACRQKETLQVNGLRRTFKENGHTTLQIGLAPLERARSFTNSMNRPPCMHSATRGRRPSFGQGATRSHMSLSSIDWRSDAMPSYGSTADDYTCSTSARL